MVKCIYLGRQNICDHPECMTIQNAISSIHPSTKNSKHSNEQIHWDTHQFQSQNYPQEEQSLKTLYRQLFKKDKNRLQTTKNIQQLQNYNFTLKHLKQPSFKPSKENDKVNQMKKNYLKLLNEWIQIQHKVNQPYKKKEISSQFSLLLLKIQIFLFILEETNIFENSLEKRDQIEKTFYLLISEIRKNLNISKRMNNLQAQIQKLQKGQLQRTLINVKSEVNIIEILQLSQNEQQLSKKLNIQQSDQKKLKMPERTSNQKSFSASKIDTQYLYAQMNSFNKLFINFLYDPNNYGNHNHYGNYLSPHNTTPNYSAHNNSQLAYNNNSQLVHNNNQLVHNNNQSVNNSNIQSVHNNHRINNYIYSEIPPSSFDQTLNYPMNNHMNNPMNNHTNNPMNSHMSNERPPNHFYDFNNQNQCTSLIKNLQQEQSIIDKKNQMLQKHWFEYNRSLFLNAKKEKTESFLKRTCQQSLSNENDDQCKQKLCGNKMKQIQQDNKILHCTSKKRKLQ